MYLKENTLFDLDLGVQVTRNVAQYPLHQVTYSATKFEVHLQEMWRTDGLTDGWTTDRLWYEINITLPVFLVFLKKNAVITSDCIGLVTGTKVFCTDARSNVECILADTTETNKTGAGVDGTISQIPTFLPFTFTLGSRSQKCCSVPSTSCHLCTCKVWSCYVQWLRFACVCVCVCV